MASRTIYLWKVCDEALQKYCKDEDAKPSRLVNQELYKFLHKAGYIEGGLVCREK